MNPQHLIPVADTIPVHWGWLQFLLILTFTLHLLAMNAMLGSGIITLIREFIQGDQSQQINKEVSLKLPYTIAFTVNMGVAPLLFLQVLYGHFIYTSSILMAVYWISIILVLILAYYAAYIYDFKFDALGEARKIFIALCVILLLWTGFIFSNNMVLMIQPEKWTAYFRNPFGTLLNLKDPMLLPRYLHFVVASVAVGGLCQAIVYTLRQSKQGNVDAVRSGLNWFSGATCVQLAVGIWFLVSLPKDKMMLFMGQGTLHTTVLILGIFGSIAALITASKGRVWMTSALTLATIIAMVLARDLLRAAFLTPYFSPADLKVAPEYSPMVVFLVSFAAGIGIIVYMLKLAASGKEG